MIRLIDPKDGKILFEGDPNADPKTFRDAMRLVPDARLEEISTQHPLPAAPPREVAYVAIFLWAILGIIAGACALGLSVRLFLLISGV